MGMGPEGVSPSDHTPLTPVTNAAPMLAHEKSWEKKER
jgi:hypothetical protein